MTKVRWYGSLENRLEEVGKDAQEIAVGMGVTEYHYSDRTAYEVVAVKDQKHITIRRLDHKHVGDGCMDNNWELISNTENPEIEVVKRGNNWYTFTTLTAEDVADFDDWSIDNKIWLWCHSGLSLDTIREKGKQTKYHKMNIRVGRAEYYYDYEF